jgi:hypothetical protein
MDRLDELLTESRPRVTPSTALDPVTTRITARRRRGLVIAGVVTLSLAGGSAAAAGTGTLDDLVNYYLNGRSNDHAWEMDITGTDGTQHCIGGIVVEAQKNNPGYSEAEYLAIKAWVQNHDWSDLQPDRSLLHDGQRGTAEQLAITADRHMMVEAQAAGFDLASVSTGGTATCWPR